MQSLQFHFTARASLTKFIKPIVEHHSMGMAALWRGKPIVEALDEVMKEFYIEEMSIVFKLGLMCTSKVPCAWFKVTVSITESDGLETYQSRCIDRVSTDT